MSEQIRIVGMVDAIYFENPTNFYKVVRLSVDEDLSDGLLGPEIVITGQFAVLHLDTSYEFFGELTMHPKYGEQFNVARYQQLAPTSSEGLIDYLSSDRFKGIGTVLASRIVNELGMDAIDQILSDPDCLKSVTGLSQKNADNLYQALLEHQGTERVFIQLTEWGFGPSISEKIYKEWGSNAIETIKVNPYLLSEKIEGIGFNKADSLAETLGLDALDLHRIVAGIYSLVAERSLSEGDTYVNIEEAMHGARNRLEMSRPALISNELLLEGLQMALDQEQLKKFGSGLMIESLYYAEESIANKLKDLSQFGSIDVFEESEIDQAISKLHKMAGISYDATQIQALKLAIRSNISIITGGPGTGKTTLIKGLILLHSILHDYNLEKIKDDPNTNPILLAAPTGRAAKRMSETTGLPASTIHRMLGFSRETQMDEFALNELEGSLLIVDEMSMVDTWLMNWLIKAIPYHMQVVMVGDRDQLPSVGPGKVFDDLISCQKIPTITLKKIYRQAKDSTIIDLAHHVRQGRLPADFLMKQADRTFIQASSQQVSHVIEQVVSAAYKKGFDTNSMQVLAPMYKGPAGVNALNTMLQELLNPADPKKRFIEHFNLIFRQGDKVIQLVNNTEESVFNGDIGHITGIFHEKETESKKVEIIVTFDDDRELVYTKSDLDQLSLAYCTTIHKAQGSEYDLVILPLVDMYSRLLRKDLLYTAITRAQSSLIMIGNPQSFEKACLNTQISRQTFLKEFIDRAFSDMAENQLLSSEIIGEDRSNKSDKMDEEVESDGQFHLTMRNYLAIDPMIGMEGSSPQDFVKVES